MSNLNVLAFTVEFKHVCDCFTCGVPIIMSDEHEQRLRRNHAYFHCINGHSQYWPAKSDVEKLRAELAEKERLLAAERERAATNYAAREKAERALKRTKKRISGGACPCCKRSFTNLGRHMDTKHPDYAESRP